MTAYIPNHQKKKNLLSKREQELRHAIKNESAQARLVKCAERVKLAKLAVLKMEFSRNSVLPASSYQPSKEAMQWIDMDFENIVELYR